MKLYKTDTKGKLRVVEILADKATVIQKSGLVDGKLTTNVRNCTSKNVGRKNETTPFEQAVIEAEAICVKKLKEGYFKTKEEALNTKVLLPMLAKPVGALSDLNYPVCVSPKLDGCRMMATKDSKLSRKNRPIDTVDHIDLSTLPIDFILDGELYCHGKSFQENIKLIKKYRKGETEDIKYHVYDLPSLPATFLERYAMLDEVIKNIPNVELVATYEAINEQEVIMYHNMFLEQGYEGTMIRTDDTHYEFNKRSNSLLKLKDFKDEEYEIIDVLDSTRRRGEGIVVCKLGNQIFKCGMRLSVKERKEIFSNKKSYIGRMAKVTFFEKTDGGLPRFPIFVGVREEFDLPLN